MGGSSGAGQGQRKKPMPFNPNQGGQIAQLMPNQGGRNKPMPFNPNQGGQRNQPMPINNNYFFDDNGKKIQDGRRPQPMPFNPNQGGQPIPLLPQQGSQRPQPMPFNPNQGGQRPQPMPFNPQQGGQRNQPMPINNNYFFDDNGKKIQDGQRPQPMPFNPQQGSQLPQPMPFNPNQGGQIAQLMPFNPNQGGQRNKPMPFNPNQGGRNKPMPFNPQQGGQRNKPMPFNRQQGGLAPKGNFDVNQAAAGGLQQAMQGTQAGMGYQAQEVDPTGYQAGQLAGADLSAYTNPYESQVVDQSLADLERTRLMQQNQLGAQASAAGAFGGSRQGIAEAETNRAFADQAARTASGLRQSGFQNAQQMAMTDIGAMNQARQFGAQQGMTAQQLNQMAGLQANQQRLGAASQMGQLGQQAFNTGQAISQQQMQQGLMQQGLQQSLIDAARGQYAGFTGAPGQSLGLPLAALGAVPNQSTTTQQKNPGLFDYLGLAATAFARSDVRLKTNIKHLGKENGINVYSWEWTDEGKRIADPSQPKVGVMAQELQETHPHLVKLGADGFLRVDYSGLAAEAA